MRRIAAVFARLAAALALAAVTLPGPAPAGVPGTSSVPAPPSERHAWGARVRELRAAERTQLDSLAGELRSLPAGAERDRARMQLEQVKRDWRRRALEAQLGRAESTGRPEHAVRLRARLAELRHAEARAARGGVR